MKRLLLVVLLLCLLMSIANAESGIDLSSFSPEQLAALQQMIEAELNSTASEETTIDNTYDFLLTLIDRNTNINPDKILDYDQYTDPNELLGTTGSYTSKTDFGCMGYADDQDGYVGGTVEYFPEESYARNRFDYLKQIYLAIPSSSNPRVYLIDQFVLRIDQIVNTSEAESLVREALTILETTITDVFDPKGNHTVELFNTDGTISTVEADDNNSLPAAETDVSTAPIPTPIPVYNDLSKGAKGSEVAKLQARLKSLGYLSGLADGDFGNQTYNAVVAFQAANSLDQTGIATSNDQLILFGSGVIAADGSIAKAYDPYEICPIELSRVDMKSSYGQSYVTFTAKNISTSVVKAFTCSVKYFDAYGDQLSSYGEAEQTVSGADVGIGKSISISTSNDYSFFIEGANSVSVAVVRVLLDDGTNLTYDDPVWFEGK